MELLSTVFARDHAVILLYDSSLNRIIFFNDPSKVFGSYNAETILSENGKYFLYGNVHPSYTNAVNEIQSKVTNPAMEDPAIEIDAVASHIIFPFKRNKAGYFQFLQKVIVVEKDKTGQPLLYLHIGYDISHLVKPFVGLILQSAKGKLFWRYNVKEKSPVLVNLLSPQEKTILKLLSEGKSSKEIGHLLFVSSHTVDTHRRNLLRKTYCINTTALIVFVKMTGLI